MLPSRLDVHQHKVVLAVAAVAAGMRMTRGRAAGMAGINRAREISQRCAGPIVTQRMKLEDVKGEVIPHNSPMATVFLSLCSCPSGHLIVVLVVVIANIPSEREIDASRRTRQLHVIFCASGRHTRDLSSHLATAKPPAISSPPPTICPEAGKPPPAPTRSRPRLRPTCLSYLLANSSCSVHLLPVSCCFARRVRHD
jgi:hypothetical protein